MVNALFLDTQPLNSILSQLQECPLIFDLNPIDVKHSAIRSRGGVVAFEGQVQIEGHYATMQVGLDERFPLSLPLVFLVPWNAFGFIPHVEQDGYVCYAPGEGLLLNRRDPVGIVKEALERSVSTLASGIRGDNIMDFVDEFEAYWRRLDRVEKVLSFVEPSQNVKKIVAAKPTDRTEKSYAFLCDDIGTVQACLHCNNLKPHTHRNALYVPLIEGTSIIPPQPGIFWTVDHVRTIVHSSLSKGNLRTLEKLGRKWKREEVVVLQLPRPSGGSALFGILYKGVEKCHPLLQGGRAQHLTPLELDRRDKGYLMPRGGANTKLQEKRLALIGCGSVGSFIALELVRTGVLNLTLIDHDILTSENTFRHVLGKEAWGMRKVEALKEEIERKLPYARIQTIAERVEKALATSMFELSSYDLIVVALGDDTVSLYLNEILRTEANAPPVVFTWLEPYGIGGHALLIGNSNHKGCLECLFTPISGDEGLYYNRASFAASGQSFAKDVSGCGSLFTPYGSTDALQTALLASRLATDALLGETCGNPLLSWKGNDREFIRAGFKLSNRYTLTEEDLYKQRYDYHNPKCPVCELAK